MRIIAIATLSALTLLFPAAAFAEGGGPISPPAVGAMSPAPPTAEAEPVVPGPAKPGTGDTALGNGSVPPPLKGADTSTAAPGGQAESTKNGALSTPADGAEMVRRHPKDKDMPDAAAKVDQPK